jgi:hypothetical protein
MADPHLRDVQLRVDRAHPLQPVQPQARCVSFVDVKGSLADHLDRLARLA